MVPKKSWKTADPVSKTVAWFTGVVALATVAYTGVTIWQLVILTQQVHIGQRAYLIVERISFGSPPAVGEKIVVTVEAKNTGQTPALEVRSAIIVAVMPQEPPEDVSYTFTPTTHNIGAGQPLKSVDARLNPLRPDEYAESMSTDPEVSMKENTVTLISHRHIYAYGKIIYKDVFGGSGEVEFCGVYVASEKQFIGCNGHHKLK